MFLPARAPGRQNARQLQRRGDGGRPPDAMDACPLLRPHHAAARCVHLLQSTLTGRVRQSPGTRVHLLAAGGRAVESAPRADGQADGWVGRATPCARLPPLSSGSVNGLHEATRRGCPKSPSSRSRAAALGVRVSASTPPERGHERDAERQTDRLPCSHASVTMEYRGGQTGARWPHTTARYSPALGGSNPHEGQPRRHGDAARVLRRGGGRRRCGDR